MEIHKEFSFDAAHMLPNLPAAHKCSRLHGHTYRFCVHLEGPILEPEGWVMDFSNIKVAVKPILDQLDHYYLNEIEGLENPTSENLARWIWKRLKMVLPQLSKITVWETCTAGCTYNGEDISV
ncbi:MAG TPA: 6-carboxytetrahydropterin synthase QueD [Burkholderiales bacterium]|nr:6-carboxytetrahydropterin synthase QueD [Burkholderiales bacterium]